MVWLGQPFVSPLVFLLACWAGCCHEMFWLGQPFVSPLVSFCLLTCFRTRWLDAAARWSGWVSSLSARLFPFVSPLVSSRACWAGCCHEMVWLGQLFVSPLVSICLPTCCLTRLLGWMLSQDRSPVVSSLACWAGCCHELVWLSQLFVSRLFPFVFSLVSSRACWAGCCHDMAWLGQLFVSPLVRICVPTCFLTRLLGWTLSRDGLPRSALCLPACFLTRLRAGCCHEMVWLGQLFVSPLVCICLPICFLTRLLGWTLSRDGLARSALCLPTFFSLACWAGCCPEMLWLGQLFVPPLVFLTRLLAWMLSRDGLARSAFCLPACFLLSPHLFPHALAGLDAVTRWPGSVSSLSPHLFPFVSPLVVSLACWAGCCHKMVWLGQPVLSPVVASLACSAGCCHGMVWLGQLFVSPLFPFVSPLVSSRACWADAVTRWSGSVSPLSPHLFAFVSPLVFSLACWAGCCLEMVWLGQLFVFLLFPFVSPLVFSLAGLDAATRWSGSVSSLSSHLFPHALAGLDAVTRWSGSFSALSPHLFAFVSPLVSSCACWAGRCHKMAWLGQLLVWRGQLFVSPCVSFFLLACFPKCLLGWTLSQHSLARSALCPPTCFHLSAHLFPHALAGLDAATRGPGWVSSVSPHLFPFVSPLVSSRACLAGRCHEMVWLGQLFVSPTCFLTCLLGWMLSRDGLARSALCLTTCFLLSPHLSPHALAGLDSVTRWSDSAAGWSRVPFAAAGCCRQAAGHVARCCRRPGLLQGAVAGGDSELRRALLQPQTQSCAECCCKVLLQAGCGALTTCCCRVLLQGCAGRRVLLPGVLGAAACRDSEVRRVLLQGAAAACCCARDAECRSCCRPRLRVEQGAFARCCCRVLLRAVLLQAETQDCCRPRRGVR